MTLVGAPDWQQQIAATSTLLGSTTRNSAAAFSVRIDTALLPQHVGIVVSIIFKAGNACQTVDWQIFDATLGIGLALDTAQVQNQAGMQVVAFPGQYVIQNPANTVNVNFAPDGTGVLVADVYVYAVSQLPLSIPQPRQPDTNFATTFAPLTVPAASTGNVVPQATPGFCWEVLALNANHVTAAAAVARVSWANQFSTNPLFETFDTAVANFVWNVVPTVFRNVVGLSFINGTSQPIRVMATVRQVPQ